MKNFILGTILVYQKTISPDHSHYRQLSLKKCRFYPSCSQYSYESIEKYGILRGLVLSINRILHCNPWSQGGVDLVH